MKDFLSIRFADEKDIPLILDFIKKLAKYEKALDKVTCSDKILYKNLFRKRYAEVLIADLNKGPIGFAIIFHNYSSYSGKPGLYIEDIYINDDFRGRGYGQKLFSFIANLAVQRDCDRVDLNVLNWNKEAIKFYKLFGAKAILEKTVFRLSGKNLQKCANLIQKNL
jgi:ribosomal protein S18 acetylase RimI-like enzyme